MESGHIFTQSNSVLKYDPDADWNSRVLLGIFQQYLLHKSKTIYHIGFTFSHIKAGSGSVLKDDLDPSWNLRKFRDFCIYISML